MEQNTYFEHPEQFSLCQRVRERLPDLVEGYLDAVAVEAVRAHLAVCFFCQKEYREMQQTIRLIETLPFVEPNRDFAPAVMAAIRAESGSFFQTPVVEMETTNPLNVSARPRSTNRHERPYPLETTDADLQAHPFDRAITAVLLIASMIWIGVTWGGAALGAQAALIAQWMRQAGEALGAFPLFAPLLAFLRHLSLGAEGSWEHYRHTITGVSPVAFVLSALLLGLIAWGLWGRRSRRVWSLKP